MRAEGVLRLILNVAMFPGMSIEVTDKYVRTVVFEDGQSRSLLIRVSFAAYRATTDRKYLN
jgi:Ran-binding protein 3